MRQIGKQPVHDFVIRSIPKLWGKRGSQSVEINPGSEKNLCAKSVDLYPMSWGSSPSRGRVDCSGWRKSKRKTRSRYTRLARTASICRIRRSVLCDCTGRFSFLMWSQSVSSTLFPSSRIILPDLACWMIPNGPDDESRTLSEMP